MLISKAHEAGQFFAPDSRFLPFFQTVLIILAMFPCIGKDGLSYALMTHSMLVELCKLSGVYNQPRIDAESQLLLPEEENFLLRQSYQRCSIPPLPIFGATWRCGSCGVRGLFVNIGDIELACFSSSYICCSTQSLSRPAPHKNYLRF